MTSDSGDISQEGVAPVERHGGRLVYLEAGRGIASVIVLLHHLILAFKPAFDAPYPIGLQFTPVYCLINGGAAVAFFFTLSGFVLSLSLIERPSRGRLATSLVKRLPRLALPVVITLMAGCLVLMAGFNHYASTAYVTGSGWLATFGNAKFPDHFSPSLNDAVRNSLLVFILGKKFYYNSNLWTMRAEYLCSLAVLMIAYLVGRFNRHRRLGLGLIAGGSAILIVANTGLALAEFGIGMSLAIVYTSWRIVLHRLLAVLAVAGVLFLVSADDPRVEAIAAGLLLFVMTTSADVEQALSGRIGYWLGRASFPLYLVHTLVILTIGSEVYGAVFAVVHRYWVAMAATSLVVVGVSVGVAMPLMWLDEWWVPTLNKAIGRLMGPMRRLVRRAA